ncbi:MAG: hypothetical protein NC087_04500 [Anaeroplasma bactoclasticum]|nr:hypothetical protein [Anaeroplasma bactoclasticum]
MTGKEAVHILYNERAGRYNVHSKGKNWLTEIESYDKVGDCLRTISNDLERLEKLEDENELLRQKYDSLKIRIDLICKEFGFDNNTDYYIGDFHFEIAKNKSELAKLEKAIDIMKKYDVFPFSVVQSNDYEHYIEMCNLFDYTKPTKEEYELLKEVLCNE